MVYIKNRSVKIFLIKINKGIQLMFKDKPEQLE
jgi:hypothetical protein